MAAPESLELSPPRPISYSLISSEERRLLLSLSPKAKRARTASNSEKEQSDTLKRLRKTVECLTPSSESGAPQNANSLTKADAVSSEKVSLYKGKENRLDSPQEALVGTEQLNSATQRAAESTDLQEHVLKADRANGNATSSQASLRKSGSNANQAVAAAEHISQPRQSRLEDRQTAGTLPFNALTIRDGFNGAISQIEIESTANEKAWANGVFTDGEATQRLKGKLAQLAAIDVAGKKLSSSLPIKARPEATGRADMASASEPCELDIVDDEAEPSAFHQWQFHHQALKALLDKANSSRLTPPASQQEAASQRSVRIGKASQANNLAEKGRSIQKNQQKLSDIDNPQEGAADHTPEAQLPGIIAENEQTPCQEEGGKPAGNPGQIKIGVAGNPILETETFVDTLIPETEVLQEGLLDGKLQETQLLHTFQETQLIQHEPSSPKAPGVTERQTQIDVGPGEAQLQPPPEIEMSCGPQHAEADVIVDAPPKAQSPQQSNEAAPDQPIMRTEPVAEASNLQPVILPPDAQRKGLPREQAYAEPPSVKAVLAKAQPRSADSGDKANLLPESSAAVEEARSEPCGVSTLTSAAEGIHNRCEKQNSLPERVPVDEGDAGLQKRSKGDQEGQPQFKDIRPDLFDLEAVQFTAAAATQVGTAEITSSMMEESEEGVSQLGSLKYTQAEANAIEEKFSAMLQRGVAEGGVYYSNAIAEHRVIQDALQPCSEKELGMLAVLLLRLFRKQHEKYPWEMTMTDSGGLSYNLDDMHHWQEEVEQIILCDAEEVQERAHILQKRGKVDRSKAGKDVYLAPQNAQEPETIHADNAKLQDMAQKVITDSETRQPEVQVNQGLEDTPDLLCSESQLPGDSSPEKTSPHRNAHFQDATGSLGVADAKTPVSNFKGPEREAISAEAQHVVDNFRASPAGQDATPEGLLASSDKAGLKDGSSVGLPRWLMLGTEVADEQVPATKEAMAQDAHLGMCQTTAAVAAPPLSAHADEIESESMPPPVPRRHPPIFNDTQNASEDKGVSGASRVLDTDPETEDVQQPGAAQEAAVLEQRLTVKDVGLKYLLHSSQPQGNLRNVKQTLHRKQRKRLLAEERKRQHQSFGPRPKYLQSSQPRGLAEAANVITAAAAAQTGAGPNDAAAVGEGIDDQAEAVEATPRLDSILDAVLDDMPASASECSDADSPSGSSSIPLMTAEQLPRGLFSAAKSPPGNAADGIEEQPTKSPSAESLPPSLPATNDELPLKELLSERRASKYKLKGPAAPQWQPFSSENPTMPPCMTPVKLPSKLSDAAKGKTVEREIASRSTGRLHLSGSKSAQQKGAVPKAASKEVLHGGSGKGREQPASRKRHSTGGIDPCSAETRTKKARRGSLTFEKQAEKGEGQQMHALKREAVQKADFKPCDPYSLPSTQAEAAAEPQDAASGAKRWVEKAGQGLKSAPSNGKQAYEGTYDYIVNGKRPAGVPIAAKAEADKNRHKRRVVKGAEGHAKRTGPRSRRRPSSRYRQSQYDLDEPFCQTEGAKKQAEDGVELRQINAHPLSIPHGGRMQSGREQANDLAEGREEKDLPAVEMSEISATDSEGSEDEGEGEILALRGEDQNASSPPLAADVQNKKRPDISATIHREDAARLGVKLGCARCRQSSIGCRTCCKAAGVVFTSHAKNKRRVSGRWSCPFTAKKGGSSNAALEGEVEAEAADKAGQQLSEVLRGSRVLLSGKDTKELAALVKTMGASVLPMPGFQAEGSPPIDMVILASSEDNNRSNKILLASILSRPVVKPSWLEACQAQRECISMRGHLWQELKGRWQGFLGLTVYIHGTALQRRIKTLLQYAGAAVVEVYTQGGENGACHPDVVFLDNPRPDARNALEDGVTCTQDEPEQERLEKVCAHAESHAIPIRNSVWLAEVIKSHDSKTIDAFRSNSKVPPTASSSRPQSSKPRKSSSASAAPKKRKRVSHVQEEEAGKNTSLEDENREAAGKLPQVEKKPTSDVEPPSGSGFRWLEQAEGPPTHLGLSTSLKQRTYYSGFIQDGRKVHLNDYVELLPNPGETETRPARVEALWSDGDDSQTFAYLSYFTRPKATIFRTRIGHEHELFKSTEVGMRVRLAAIKAKCLVHFQENLRRDLPLYTDNGLANFYCEFQYDVIRETLSGL